MTTADTFLFSCLAARQRAAEQVVPEHTLTYVVAGELQFQLPTATRLVEPGVFCSSDGISWPRW